MPINVLQAAKHLCKKSDWKLSNLELQKMIYICHMFYFGQQNEPLVSGDFEAWDYGPVHPSLYHHLKRYGAKPIDKSAFEAVEDLCESNHKGQIEILNYLLKSFPPGSGPKLVAITHWDNGAWAKHYRPREKNIVLPIADILEEYKELQKKYPQRS